MLNNEIADLLCEYRRAKNEQQEITGKLIRFAVEDLGMDQQEASRCNIALFFDGYLVGRGVHQSWRNLKADV